MTQLAPIELEDGTVIYIEATEDIEDLLVNKEEEQRPIKRGVSDQVVQSFNMLQGTISAYTTYTLNAFKQVAIANVDKVTLEFGIKVGTEAAVPYITKGTAESNLKITVECSFPQE
jgi:hypothetical protein